MSEEKELQHWKWNQLKDQLEKSDQLSSVQKAILKKLILSGEKYEEEGNVGFAKSLHDRILLKMQQQLNRNSFIKERKNLHFIKVSQHFEDQGKSETLNYINHKKRWIPNYERKFFKSELENQKVSLAYTKDENSNKLRRISEIRSDLMDRVNYFHTLKKPEVSVEYDKDVQIGPYNTRENMKILLDYIGEKDPMWIEDFKNLYKELSKIETLFT